MSRKQSRELAFRLLFSLAFRSEALVPLINEELLDAALLGEKCPDATEMAYITKLVAAVCDNLDEIDGIIKDRSKGFVFDRIFKTDLTALRLGIAEIKYVAADDTHAIVVVNEVIEIAKKYGTEKSGVFVNGILAALIQ